MIRWSPEPRTEYTEAPILAARSTSYVAPPSKWPTKPRELKGLTKNAVSETVFAIPTLPYGVSDETLVLKVFVQSAVTRPVLKPRLLSPVGAVNSRLDVKLIASLLTPAR